MVGFRAKAIRGGPFVIFPSVHIRGGGGTGQGSGRWWLCQLSAPPTRIGLSLSGSGRGRYTSNPTVRMNRGAEEDVRLKFEAGAEQRRVLMRGRTSRKGSTGLIFRRWPLSHYILDSAPGGPNDAPRGWQSWGGVGVVGGEPDVLGRSTLNTAEEVTKKREREWCPH